MSVYWQLLSTLRCRAKVCALLVLAFSIHQNEDYKRTRYEKTLRRIHTPPCSLFSHACRISPSATRRQQRAVLHSAWPKLILRPLLICEAHHSVGAEQTDNKHACSKLWPYRSPRLSCHRCFRVEAEHVLDLTVTNATSPLHTAPPLPQADAERHGTYNR